MSDRIVVRRSRIHGRGVFAARRIRAGSRIIEYTGERIDDAEIEARYGRGSEHGHTMLFAVDDVVEALHDVLLHRAPVAARSRSCESCSATSMIMSSWPPT